MLHGGSTVGVGDEVVTRENNRLLATGKRWVKNGDRWMVTATNDDGSMTVKRAGGGGEVVLPADYVASHVELAYATTAYRAQGRTVDTAHALVTAGTAREVLYVAATRGRQSNRLYVDTHYDPDPATSHEGMTPTQTARQVLYGCLQREGADRGAHDVIRASQDAAESLSTLHAEYTTIARAAQEDRWEALLDRSGLSAVQLAEVRESEAHGPLLAAFRDAEARGVDIESDFPTLVALRSLVDAEDIASVLHGRVEGWTKVAGSKRTGTTQPHRRAHPAGDGRDGPRHGKSPRRTGSGDRRPCPDPGRASGRTQRWMGPATWAATYRPHDASGVDESSPSRCCLP